MVPVGQLQRYSPETWMGWWLEGQREVRPEGMGVQACKDWALPLLQGLREVRQDLTLP